MNLLSYRKNEEKRKIRNQEICQAIKDGEYVPPAMNIFQSWYPERPIIKKDQKAIKSIYGEKK